MISILPNFTSIPARGSGPAARHGARSVVPLATILCALAACTENGIVEPARSASPFAAGTAAVIVTPTYSAFDRRSEFTAAGTIAHLGDFEAGFTGSPTYPLASPWASNGVTYTSGVNVILGPAITFGVRSNAISTTFGAPLIGEFAAADAFTMLGIDLTEIIQKVPVTLAVSTNLATYSFPDLDIPLAETGSRFLGLTLSQPGEYLTGFRLTYSGPGTALLLDNVAVGHVGGANAEPDVDAGGVYVGLEGSAIALAMSGTDADGDALTYSWDLGDGTTGAGATPPTNHIYAENGSYDIMLAADDGRGGADTSRTTATVANVAPVVSPFSLPSVPIALVGGRVTLPVSAGFSDPGATDTHLMTLDCGTGVSIQENTPNGTAGGTC